MTLIESIIGFLLLMFATAIVKFGVTGLHIAAVGIATLIAIAVAVIILDQRSTIPKAEREA